jgi:hypothetical protein
MIWGRKSHACESGSVRNRSENKYGTGKSVGDRFAMKILNLKFMMMSHEFLYACDTGEKKRSVQKGQVKVVKLKSMKEAIVET